MKAYIPLLFGLIGTTIIGFVGGVIGSVALTGTNIALPGLGIIVAGSLIGFVLGAIFGGLIGLFAGLIIGTRITRANRYARRS